MGLVSTVTHVHPTQPRPGAAGTTSPRIPRTAFPLHTRLLEPDPKETPKAPFPHARERSRPSGAARGLRASSPCRRAGREPSASTPDSQKLDNCVTDCQTHGSPGTPTPPLRQTATQTPGPDLSGSRHGKPAARASAPPPNPAAGARASADLASRRSREPPPEQTSGHLPRPLHPSPAPSSRRTPTVGAPPPRDPASIRGGKHLPQTQPPSPEPDPIWT